MLEVIASAMRDIGYDEVEIDPLGNLIGTVRGAGDAAPILFDGHVDVVDPGDLDAWPSPPFEPTIDGGSLVGRGAVDMKGPVAAMVHGVAAARGKLAGDVVVSCSVMEETQEGAALGPVLDRLAPRGVVIAEPSDLGLLIGQRGRAELHVEIAGRQAHSAFPAASINPIAILQRFLVRLEASDAPVDPLLGAGISVPTDVVSEPRPANSVTPYVVRLTLDRRLLEGESVASVLAPLQAMLDESCRECGDTTGRVFVAPGRFVTWSGAALDVDKFAPGWKMPPDAPLVERAAAALGEPAGAYAVCTNGSASAGLRGIPTIGFGPGDPTQSHQVGERIPIAQLEEAVDSYAALAIAISGGW